MVKLAIVVILEILAGVAGAALMLAVTVPILMRHHVIVPGDLAGAILIGAVLVLAVSAALFRPGSALNRADKHN